MCSVQKSVLSQKWQLFIIGTDHFNTPLTISDQNGTVVWRWDGKPFGDIPANTGPDGDGNPLDSLLATLPTPT